MDLGSALKGQVSVKVRQIIRSGGFEPEDVKLLDAVFDACWHQMECHYLGEDISAQPHGSV